MKNAFATASTPAPTASVVRSRVQNGPRRFWTAQDFPGLPPQAVTQALSRLHRDGELTRPGKGLYYRPAPTSFGASRPSSDATAANSVRGHGVHPAGLSAANVLGLTTQNSMRGEFATSASGKPAALSGSIVHARRPKSRDGLAQVEGALLEVLRDRADTSDLSPELTVERVLAHVAEPARFRLLVEAAADEPPRVRAMLGAMGQQLGMPERELSKLRASLNPLTRFKFGKLAGLRYAKDWQAA